MFYEDVMKRPHLAGYFQNVSLERLIPHQIRLVSVVLGKPPEFYQGPERAVIMRQVVELKPSVLGRQ